MYNTNFEWKIFYIPRYGNCFFKLLWAWNIYDVYRLYVRKWYSRMCWYKWYFAVIASCILLYVFCEWLFNLQNKTEQVKGNKEWNEQQLRKNKIIISQIFQQPFVIFIFMYVPMYLLYIRVSSSCIFSLFLLFYYYFILIVVYHFYVFSFVSLWLSSFFITLRVHTHSCLFSGL